MEPVRVLHVVGRMVRAGIETMIMNLYRNIDRDKVQFDFLAHYGDPDAPYNEEIRALGGRIYEMPPLKDENGVHYELYFQYKKALNEFFKEHQEYNIIHGHMTNTAAIYLPIAKKYGVGCRITHSHNEKGAPGLSGVVSTALSQLAPRYATHYFACSKGAANWFYSKKAIESGEVKVIYNGIDTDRFVFSPEIRAKKRAELGLKDGQLAIANVARFRPQKNLPYFVDIMQAMDGIDRDARMIFAGEGELQEMVEQKAKDAGIYDRFMFLGGRPDVNELLQAFDVFVLPSFFEGLPVSGVEAQAAGLPCLFSDTVSRDADITGNVTFLPLSAGPESWARNIVTLAEDFHRVDVQDKIISAGYDIKSTVKLMQEFYLANGVRKQ